MKTTDPNHLLLTLAIAKAHNYVWGKSLYSGNPRILKNIDDAFTKCDQPAPLLPSHFSYCPYWVSTIDAAYELENEIPTENARADYARILTHIIHVDTNTTSQQFALLHASPAQRCEAWLAWKALKSE